MLVIGVLSILTIAKTVLSGSALKFSLDQPSLCQTSNIVTRWLNADDVVIVHAKTGNEEDHRRFFDECMLKLGPMSDSAKQTVKIKIESYYNGDCGVYLAVQQSPVSFFNEQVSTLFNLSCRSLVPHNKVYYGEASNNIKIFLQKESKDVLNYNFVLNITLIDHNDEKPVMSKAIIICILVIIAIAIFGTACIILRCLKIKNWSKRQYESEMGYSPRNLAHDSPTSTRYSNLPVGENHSNHVSQACVVGTEGADGLCTVCNRHHDDFAHIVDVGPDGEVLETVNSHRGYGNHRHDGVVMVNRDGAIHVLNSNHSTPRSGVGGQFGVHRNNQPLTGSVSRLVPPNRQSAPLSSSGEIMLGDDGDDDEDIDVSGNDLIPPSYDLSPPSYDEALNMPKPDTEVNATVSHGQQNDVTETDPLYQNIDSLSHDVR